jgi:hypothetical protein
MLFCLPMIGFGQDDCGKRPSPPNAFNNPTTTDFTSKELREYKKILKEYNACIFKDIDKNIPTDKTTNLIKFQGVIDAEGMNTNDIYYSLKEWFVSSNNSAMNYTDQSFLSSKKLFEVDNKDNGIIITQMQHEIRADNTSHIDEEQKGSLIPLLDRHKQYWIKYTLKLEIKKGRFRYTVTDFIRDFYLVNDNTTINEKKKKWFKKRKPVAKLEELVIDKLYKENGDIEEDNAYLKLKFFNLIEQLHDSFEQHMKSKSEDDNW